MPECYFSGMVHSRILYHGSQDNEQMCLKFQFLVTLGPRSTQMMCTHSLSRERVGPRQGVTNVTLTCTTATRMWAAPHCWKVTRKLPQVVRSTSRTITRTRRIERCVRNVQLRHFLIEVLGKRQSSVLPSRSSRLSCLPSPLSGLFLRTLTLSSRPSLRIVGAIIGLPPRSDKGHQLAYHMYVDGHKALFLCRETETTLGSVQGFSGTVTENGFDL